MQWLSWVVGLLCVLAHLSSGYTITMNVTLTPGENTYFVPIHLIGVALADASLSLSVSSAAPDFVMRGACLTRAYYSRDLNAPSCSTNLHLLFTDLTQDTYGLTLFLHTAPSAPHTLSVSLSGAGCPAHRVGPNCATELYATRDLTDEPLSLDLPAGTSTWLITWSHDLDSLDLPGGLLCALGRGVPVTCPTAFSSRALPRGGYFFTFRVASNRTVLLTGSDAGLPSLLPHDDEMWEFADGLSAAHLAFEDDMRLSGRVWHGDWQEYEHETTQAQLRLALFDRFVDSPFAWLGGAGRLAGSPVVAFRARPLHGDQVLGVAVYYEDTDNKWTLLWKESECPIGQGKRQCGGRRCERGVCQGECCGYNCGASPLECVKPMIDTEMSVLAWCLFSFSLAVSVAGTLLLMFYFWQRLLCRKKRKIVSKVDTIEA